MAKLIDISQLGDKRLQKKLDKLDKRVQKAIVRRGLRKAAKDVLESARAIVPVDTGALRDGLAVKALKPKRGSFGVQVVTPTRAELGIPADAKGYYPAVVEYGSDKRNLPPRPYLRPALDQNREKGKRTVADSIRAEVAKTKA
ncbi:MAG: HK97-gp10 family putative phage morphogenesis protein [Gammaproteobacteria bacterium]